MCEIPRMSTLYSAYKKSEQQIADKVGKGLANIKDKYDRVKG